MVVLDQSSEATLDYVLGENQQSRIGGAINEKARRRRIQECPSPLTPSDEMNGGSDSVSMLGS